MTESDWKEFKDIKEKALERFCDRALVEIKHAIDCENISSHDRYLKIYNLVENTDKRLATIFNGLSRSKATMQLLLIRNEGLVKEAELENLSEEFLMLTRLTR